VHVDGAAGAMIAPLAARIADLGPSRLLTDGSELPVFAFTVPGDGFSAFDVSAALRERGRLVPAACPDRTGAGHRGRLLLPRRPARPRLSRSGSPGRNATIGS
jgi:glutamate/tyrosine decarboxylase-like PLP-dependent enzyme